MANSLITKGKEVFLLTDDGETVSLPMAVGILAMSVYGNFSDLNDAKDSAEEKVLKKKIRFELKVLNALSNACEATRK